MDVAVIGAGNMGRAIARRLLVGGHQAWIANRNADKAKAVCDEIGALGGRGRVATASIADAIARGRVIIFATWFAATLRLAAEFAEAFGDRVVVDISNPLNERFDGLVTPPTTSGAETIRRRAPRARWVKAFNTLFAPVLFEGQLDGGQLDVFIASDDADAKKIVVDLVESSGLRAINAGALKNARTLERMMLLWIEMQGRYGLGFRAASKLIPETDPLPVA